MKMLDHPNIGEYRRDNVDVKRKITLKVPVLFDILRVPRPTTLPSRQVNQKCQRKVTCDVKGKEFCAKSSKVVGIIFSETSYRPENVSWHEK